ncbi:putative olfactory receptor 142-like [Scophthalmus maximus]|uniref:Putative olfactory receptor 142-like n=1 Tax=Scophthalmus maximus TaxID=52904 RepID=A0A2U9B6H7_SCOMX|nr:putative olfactory receptor 142-like [Scophthalmus maximus]
MSTSVHVHEPPDGEGSVVLRGTGVNFEDIKRVFHDRLGYPRENHRRRFRSTKRSNQTRQKAVSTCSPHLASLLNFSFGAFFEIMQSRFDMSSVHIVVRIVLSLYWLTCQPLFNPLFYGLKLSKIRFLCKSLLFGKKPGDS